MLRNRGSIFFIIAFAAMSICTSPLSADMKPGDIVEIPNSSFDVVQNGLPVAWSKTTWKGKADFEYSSIGHNSGGCVKISSVEGADAGWFTHVEVKPFHNYKLVGWIKTANFQKHTGNGALLNIHNNQPVKTNAVTETSDWTRVEAEFMASTDSIQINCLFGGWGESKGTAFFDDIRLIYIAIPEMPETKTVESTVVINANIEFEPISKYIYGQFIEHLGQCIYGGIWAEMLEDRKFYYAIPANHNTWETTGSGARVLRDSPWKVIGPKASIKMTKELAYSGEHSPQITAAGQVAGIYQEELALVKGRKYEGRIVIAGDKSAAPVKVSLVWGPVDEERQTIKITQLKTDYSAVTFDFTADADTDNGRLEISSSKGRFAVGAVSLMPADNIEGFRRDTLALLKEIDSPVYRWPGGNFVSGYDWRDGIGDRDRRPTRANPAWTGIEINDVGIHEFIRLCELIDTEPMIAVNTGFSDAYSAAAEVEYCNGSKKSHYGKMRVKNGSSKPFNVKWWCVGNEMFGAWQLGYMQLNHYTLKHNWVEDMMRQTDPDIKTVGVGCLGGRWSEGMLKKCSDNMDLISEHFYCQGRADIAEHVAQIPQNIKKIADAHRKYRNEIDQLANKDIRIALDEWNYWYGKHVYGELGTRYYSKDMLGIAAGLHEYFRNSDIMFMANYAQTVNVIGCIKTTKTDVSLATTALPLMMYRKEFGTIPVEVSNAKQPLDISAALTTDGKTITVAAVNPTWDTHIVSLDLKGLKIAKTATCLMIEGHEPFAYNVPGKEPAVSITEKKNVNAEKITVPPLSVAMYKIDVER
jgi:alpha-L-arabinofuranosidase